MSDPPPSRSSRRRGICSFDPHATLPSVNVSTRLSAPQFDAAYQRARAEGVTLSEWFRAQLLRTLARDQ